MRRNGFTLVELLVSLFIFGLLSAAGVALLSLSLKAQAAAGERLDALAQIRRAGAILTSDLAQAAPRISRDEAGATRAAFGGRMGTGDAVSLALVRRGWENVNGAPRPSLQKVQYSLSGGRLQRRAFEFVDGAAPGGAVTLVDGVRRLQLRYRDKDGSWRERWDPTKLTDMPRAVELVIDTGRESIRQVFIVGTAT